VKVLVSDYPMIDLPLQLLIYTPLVIVVFRFGLVALATGMVVADVLLNAALTLDFSAWYASTGVVVLLSVAAIAVWGFFNALGGQKLWQTDPFS